MPVLVRRTIHQDALCDPTPNRTFRRRVEHEVRPGDRTRCWSPLHRWDARWWAGAHVVYQPLVDASDYLTKLSLHEDRVATGALLTLIMGVALVGVSMFIYPVLRRHSERLALGYVVARTVESVFYVIDALLLLTLLTVSRGFVDAGAPDASHFQALGDSVLGARDWAGNTLLDLTAFGLSALILCALSGKTRASMAVGLGSCRRGAVHGGGGDGDVRPRASVDDPGRVGRTAGTAGNGPREIWLIVRGFNSPAAVAAPDAEMVAARV